jgi:hypothetical protein
MEIQTDWKPQRKLGCPDHFLQRANQCHAFKAVIEL